MQKKCVRPSAIESFCEREIPSHCEIRAFISQQLGSVLEKSARRVRLPLAGDDSTAYTFWGSAGPGSGTYPHMQHKNTLAGSARRLRGPGFLSSASPLGDIHLERYAPITSI